MSAALEPAIEDAGADLSQAFRPHKKRKLFRKRVDAAEEADDTTTAPPAPPSPATTPSIAPKFSKTTARQDDGQEDTDITPSAALSSATVPREALATFRRPKQARRRIGIEFAVESTRSADSPSSTMESLPNQQHRDYMSRFASSSAPKATIVDTGTTAATDPEHLHSNTSTHSYPTFVAASALPHDASADSASPDAAAEQQDQEEDPEKSTAQGKILEVSLPSSTPAPPQKPPKKPKPRLGRDGKPFLPRKKGQRTEEDIARDKLVESLLHEHSNKELAAVAAGAVGTVGTASTAGTAGTASTSGATHAAARATTTPAGPFTPPPPPTATQPPASTADEFLAASFQAEYLAREREREELRAAHSVDKDDKKGPKLGGSRSARALVHAREREEALRKGRRSGA